MPSLRSSYHGGLPSYTYIYLYCYSYDLQIITDFADVKPRIFSNTYKSLLAHLVPDKAHEAAASVNPAALSEASPEISKCLTLGQGPFKAKQWQLKVYNPMLLRFCPFFR